MTRAPRGCHATYGVRCLSGYGLLVRRCPLLGGPYSIQDPTSIWPTDLTQKPSFHSRGGGDFIRTNDTPDRSWFSQANRRNEVSNLPHYGAGVFKDLMLPNPDDAPSQAL